MVTQIKKQASEEKFIFSLLKKNMVLAIISFGFMPELVVALPKDEITVAQQPRNSAKNPTIQAAELAYEEARKLFEQRTPESLRQAITKLEESLKLYRAVGDQKWESIVLLWIGRVYSELQENQQALNYYNQSLALSRKLKDRFGEGIVLNNIGLVYDDLGQEQTALNYYNQSLSLNQQIDNKQGKALTLSNMASIYRELGEKQKAIDFYNQALSLYRELGDTENEKITIQEINNLLKEESTNRNDSGLNNTRSNENISNTNLGASVNPNLSISQERTRRNAKQIFQEGMKLYEEGTVESLRQAIPKFEEAARLFKEAGDQRLEAVSLFSIGNVYLDLQDNQKALEFFNQALPLRRIVGDKRGEATTLNNIGGVYDSLGEKQKALEFYNQALPLLREVGDKRGEATTLNNIGAVYDSLGEKQKALKFYNQALPLTRVVGDRGGEATTLNNIGFVYDSLGEKQKALEFYNQALPLLREVGDKRGEATTLNNIGAVYDSLGEKQKGLEFYNQALPLLREVGDKRGEAMTLNNIGAVYDSLGEKQKALEFFNQALSLRRAVRDKRGEATTLNNIGAVYDSLGEKQKALEFYNQALPLLREVGDRGGEAMTLNNIGAVYDSLREKQKALDFYSQALLLRRAVRDRGGEAATLNNIGAVYNSLGEKQKALDFYSQALPLRRAVRDRGGEAMTLNNIGFVYHSLGEKQKALEFYNQVLPLVRTVGDKDGEAASLGNIASLERDRGNLDIALTQIESAITIIEDLRTKIGSQKLRASYFATVQDYYQFYIDLLMQLHQQNPSKGYDAQALHISERARARSLLELLTEAGANIRQGVDPQLLEQESKLQQKLNAIERRKHELLGRQYTEQQINDIEQQSNFLLSQIEQLKAQIRLTSPRYAALKYPQPLTLKQIQDEVLDDNTLLLEYALGEERSYLWAVTKNSITSYVLPKQSEIETAVQNFRKSVIQNSGANLETGLPLSQILLSPVANQLANKRLLIVGDAALQYVPFSALPLPSSPNTPLLVQNEIVTLPSASTVAIQKRQFQNRTPAAKTLAVIADPVFNLNDSRLANRQQQTPETEVNYALTRASRNLGLGEGRVFDRLQFTRTEGEKILALVPENSRLQAFDFKASRESATSPNLEQYQILHLATHGLLDPINPELSGVVLSLYDENGKSRDGFLRLQDIFNMNLPAELVVLSACETGLGENVKGEGLVGLTRGFMYAGARRVVVSLWSVNDLATSELMAKFYQKMLQEKQNPVTALREAQLEMWKSENWRSPYYWAAFTVQGDWR